MIQQARQVGIVLKKSFTLMAKSNPLLLSAATAFFTTFALSPILIILSHLLDIFFDEKVMLSKLFIKIALAVGQKASKDIRAIVENFLSLETSTVVKIAFTVFFYFVATTLLSAIRQSIHLLWDIRKKPTKKIRFSLKERLIEIGMILMIGILFLVTILLDNGLIAFQQFIDKLSPVMAHITFLVLDATASIMVISMWFTLLFKYMPETHVHWRVALSGGTLTGILFVVGRFAIARVLVHGKIGEIFGPSGSIATVLLLIFYCSFILYFGASFTYEYAKATHRQIKPGKLAEKYKEKVVRTGSN